MEERICTVSATQPFLSRRRWTARIIGVSLALLAWSVPPSSADSLLIEVPTGSTQAGRMQSIEVNIVEEVGEDFLFQFIQDCHLRGGWQPQTDWSVTAVSLDDLLHCRSRASPAAVELDIQTLSPDAQRDAFAARDGGSPLEIVGHFIPERGYEQRIRFGQGAGAWTAWTTSSVLRSIRVPPGGEENALHFEVELRPLGGVATVAMSGYIKVKKLHSGG